MAPGRSASGSGVIRFPLVRQDDAIAKEISFHLRGQVFLVPGIQWIELVLVDQDGLLPQPFLPGFIGYEFEYALAELAGPGLMRQSFSVTVQLDALYGSAHGISGV